MWIKFLNNFTFFLKKNNFMTHFYRCGSTVSRLQSNYEESVNFYHSIPRSSWYSFNRPRKDERLNWTRSQPVVLNPGLLDWESSPLTARPFPNNHFFKKMEYFKFHMDSLHLTFTKIWQTFTHTKQSQKVRCFLYTVILIFTSNFNCRLQRYMKS